MKNFDQVEFLWVVCALDVIFTGFVFSVVSCDRIKNNFNKPTESEKKELSNIPRRSLDAQGRAGTFSGWSENPTTKAELPNLLATPKNLHVKNSTLIQELK